MISILIWTFFVVCTVGFFVSVYRENKANKYKRVKR